MFASRSVATTMKEHTRNENCMYFSGASTIGGTEDFLTTSSCNATATDSTYCIWWKSGLAGSAQGAVFGHGGASGADSYAGVLDIHTQISVKFRMDGGTPDRDVEWGGGDDPSTLNLAKDNIWHHWAFVIDVSDMTACKCYVDGVLKTVLRSDNDGDTDTWSSLVIGVSSISATTRSEFRGWISDFAVYEKLLTASDVKMIYNEGNPYNHREQSSNGRRLLTNFLKGWWQMGDGSERIANTGRFSGKVEDMSGNGKIATATNFTVSPFQMVTSGLNTYGQ